MADPGFRPPAPEARPRNPPARRGRRISGRGGQRPGPTPEPPPKHAWTWRDIPPPARWLAAILALLALAVLIFILVFQWNWLRRPIGAYVSSQMHRTVTLNGNLTGHPWSWTPRLTAEDVSVAEPAWAGPGAMIRIPRLTVAIDLPALLRGKLILPIVDADHPDIRMRRDAAGRNNWTFGPPNQTPGPLKLPPIRHFTIRDGRLSLDDARRKLTFRGAISSNEQITGAGRGRFSLNGEGELNRTPFSAIVTGGPLLNVDPDKPYAFHADVRAGATHLVADGDIPHPFDLGVLTARVHASGPDLAQLYYLTGLTLPNSPPYDFNLNLRRNQAHYDLRNLAGRFGQSDLAGALTVDLRNGRRFLSGDLASRRLKLADLTAVIGGAPRGVVKGTITSPAQQAMAAKLAAEHRILPDAKLDVARIRQMDADVRYRAESVDAGPLPIRQLRLRADLDNGLLVLDPLSLVLPQGSVTGGVRLDARQATPREAIDLKLANARLEELLPRRGGVLPMEGELAARARLVGAGASVRAAAASANGTVALAIPQGQMRQAFAELLGIDATKGLFMLLAKDQKPTPIRCAVAEFHSQNGVLTARRILLDTGVLQARGAGVIDLRNETVNLAFKGKPKHFRLIRVDAPITLKGSLAAPKVGVDLGKAAGQLGVGAVLGALVSPLTAVLPFIAPGTAKDADCGALLSEAAAEGARP